MITVGPIQRIILNGGDDALNKAKVLITEVQNSINSHYQFNSRDRIRLEVLEDFFWVISGQYFNVQEPLSPHASIEWVQNQEIQDADRQYLIYLDGSLKKASSSEEKIRLYNKKAVYYFNKADQEEKENQLSSLYSRQKAQRNYQESLRLNPQEFDASFGYAKCLIKLSKYNQAIQFLDQKKHLLSSSAEYWIIASIAHRKANDYGKAKGYAIEALRIDSKNKEADKEKKLIEALNSNGNTIKNLSLYKQTQKIEETYFTRRQIDENPHYKILSIDGGGIRGILPALWLSEIEKRTHRPISHLFNMAAGTSTGAIIAGGLSVPDLEASDTLSSYCPRYSASDLLQLYTEKPSEIFTKNWRFVPNLITTKYTGDGRLKMFNAYFGKTTLDKALMELVIPAANESNLTHSHLFTRYDSKRDPADNVTFVESLMATTAAPTFFPSYEIQGKGIFSDGGIHLNNPAMIAYTEACRYRAPRDRIFVLSMGTGSYIPDPEDPDLYRGQLFWAQNLHKIALPAQEGNTDKSMYHLLGNRYQRWQVLMEEPIALDADKKDDIDRLINAGQQHIEELYASDDNTLNNLIEFLQEDPISPPAKNVFFNSNPALICKIYFKNIKLQTIQLRCVGLHAKVLLMMLNFLLKWLTLISKTRIQKNEKQRFIGQSFKNTMKLLSY